MSSDFFASHLAALPVVGIFRGFDEAATVALCTRAWDAGVDLVEIPVQTDDAFPSLRAGIEAARVRGALVGAGTVTTLRQLDAVLDAGAAFVVSPGLHLAVAEECVRLGVPILPGVATATEIAAAVELGLTWLKAFPAAQLTPGWVTAQHGPFPEVRFVATGGITADNAAAFLAAGCSGVAVGSAFSSPEQIGALRTAVEPYRRIPG
ncbi:MAG: eda [Frondihabitans sp.]|nr:eda [Frondihabitans sp.]